MKSQIYKFDATLKRLIDEAGYKHIALESQEGERIVSFNPAKTKITTKWEEIRRRLLAQPDGFFKLLATSALGGKNKSDVYIVQKGTPPAENLEEKPIKEIQYIPSPRSKDDAKREEVLSLSEALKRIEELTTLKVNI